MVWFVFAVYRSLDCKACWGRWRRGITNTWGQRAGEEVSFIPWVLFQTAVRWNDFCVQQALLPGDVQLQAVRRCFGNGRNATFQVLQTLLSLHPHHLDADQWSLQPSSQLILRFLPPIGFKRHNECSRWTSPKTFVCTAISGHLALRDWPCSPQPAHTALHLQIT